MPKHPMSSPHHDFFLPRGEKLRKLVSLCVKRQRSEASGMLRLELNWLGRATWEKGSRVFKLQVPFPRNGSTEIKRGICFRDASMTFERSSKE